MAGIRNRKKDKGRKMRRRAMAAGLWIAMTAGAASGAGTLLFGTEAVTVAAAETEAGVDGTKTPLDGTESEETEKRDDRPKAQEFPDKTIIIGTYAIYLDVISDELFEAASASAEESEQRSLYFKSDLTPGVWYDITGAVSITDIMSGGKAAANQTIDALVLTHYAKPSGELVEFTEEGEQKVYPSDLFMPVDPTKLTECGNLVKERDLQNGLADSASGDSKKIYQERVKSLDRVLALIEGYEEVDALTAQIHAAEDFIGYLHETQADQNQTDAASEAKELVQKQRSTLCYSIVKLRMNREISGLDYDKHLDLIEKYSSALTEIESALSEFAADSIAVDLDAIDISAEEKEEEEEQGDGEGEGEDPKDGEDSEDGEEKTDTEDSAPDDGKEEGEEGEEEKEGENEGENEGEGEGDGPESKGEIKKAVSVEVDEYDAVRQLIADSEEKMLIAAEQGDYALAEQALLYSMTGKSVRDAREGSTAEEKEKQIAFLEEACQIQKGLIIQLAGEGGGTALAEANKAGESAEVLNTIKADAKEAFVSGLNRLKAWQEQAIALTESEEEKAGLFGEMEQALEEIRRKAAASDIPDILEPEAEAVLLEAQEEKQEFLLAVSPEYKKAAEDFQKALKRAEALNESYLGALEDQDSRFAAQYEKELADAKKELTDAEEELSRTEKEFAQGMGEKDDTSGKTGQTDGETGGTGQTDETNGDGSGQTAGTEQDAEEKRRLTGDSSGLSGEDARLAENLAARYSVEEMRALEAKGKVLAAAAKRALPGAEVSVIQPWNLLFKNPEAVISAPAARIGKTIYVPAEELMKAFGGNVTYSSRNSVVVLRGKGVLIEFIPGDQNVYVNDKKMKLSLAPSALLDGKIYLSLECFKKAYGMTEETSGDYVILSR